MFGGFYQIGFVTKDRERSMRFFKETLGVPKFLALENPEIRNQTLYGKPLECAVNLAFGQMGNTSIEVIEPVEGHSTYDDMLERYDWMGMHHIAVKVFDRDKAISDMKAQGIEIAQSGELGKETKFAYMDTVAHYGHFLEILYFDLDYEKLFDSIRRGDF